MEAVIKIYGCRHDGIVTKLANLHSKQQKQLCCQDYN